MFRDFTQVLDSAKGLETKDLIVANPEDKSILIAINDAFQMGLIRPVLVGDKAKILDLLNGTTFIVSVNSISFVLSLGLVFLI